MIFDLLPFNHLRALTTDMGIYEHTEFTEPREHHGYCLDDAARALAVTSRAVNPPAYVAGMARTYLDFVLKAQTKGGSFHNRLDTDGTWEDRASIGDHWGRALWALGVTAEYEHEPKQRTEAFEAMGASLHRRSPHLRPMAYAALGAVSYLTLSPASGPARSLLEDARTLITPKGDLGVWPWPEVRLSYANAVIPEALIAIGGALEDQETLDLGLRLLQWLALIQVRGTHVSPIPAGGWAKGEMLPGFDQQAIEVSALAEACFRAWQLTGQTRWTYHLDRCKVWFLGWNDTGKAMIDPFTGAGYDGLLVDGVNLNMGAESTLAALATFQLASAAQADKPSWIPVAS